MPSKRKNSTVSRESSREKNNSNLLKKFKESEYTKQHTKMGRHEPPSS